MQLEAVSKLFLELSQVVPKDTRTEREVNLRRELDRAREGQDLMLADIDELLGACGLGLHARDKSPHEVMQSEILPRIREMVEAIPYWTKTETAPTGAEPKE